VLVVNRKLRVANDVDEQDIGDLELDLFLDLGAADVAATNKAIVFNMRL